LSGVVGFDRRFIALAYRGKVLNYGHLKDFILLFIIKFGPTKTMLSKVIFNTSVIR